MTKILPLKAIAPFVCAHPVAQPKSMGDSLIGPLTLKPMGTGGRGGAF